MPKLKPNQLKKKYDQNNSHKEHWRSIYEKSIRTSVAQS